MDPVLDRPIVLLTNEDGDLIVPIWVGVFEANAILIELEKVSTPRPITHDLMKQMMSDLEIKVSKVIITDLVDAVYYATIEIQQDNRSVTLDSRPSDAIAMALRFNAPIFVTEPVLMKSSSAEHGAELGEDDEMRKWIDQLKPGDFEATGAD